KVAATLRVQPAVPGQRASDLADTVGAEVEADAGIVIANRRQRPAALVGADKGHNKLVRHPPIVGVFHALHWIGALAALSIAIDHGVVGLGNALPPPVTIHRIVSPVHGSNLAGV